MTRFLDRIGMSASILCGIHCLLTPLIVLSAPALGHLFSHAAFHWIIGVIVFPVAAVSLWLGYRLHRYPQMLFLGGVGLIFVAIGIYAGSGQEHNLETGAMIIAGIFLTSAHFLNLRACQTQHLKSTPAPPSPPRDRSSATTAPRKEPGTQES